MKTFRLSSETVSLILDQQIDIYDILADRESRIQPGEDVLIQEMYDSVAQDHRLCPDDDFEEIINIMLDQIEQEYS